MPKTLWRPQRAETTLEKRHQSVHIGPDEYITALTDDGIDELRDMLASARVSVEEWQSFLEDFVAEPDIIARVKNQPLR